VPTLFSGRGFVLPLAMSVAILQAGNSGKQSWKLSALLQEKHRQTKL
jgi:hypothetical protein